MGLKEGGERVPLRTSFGDSSKIGKGKTGGGGGGACGVHRGPRRPQREQLERKNEEVENSVHEKGRVAIGRKGYDRIHTGEEVKKRTKCYSPEKDRRHGEGVVVESVGESRNTPVRLKAQNLPGHHLSHQKMRSLGRSKGRLRTEMTAIKVASPVGKVSSTDNKSPA